jgi:hypothetical protein
MTQRQDAQQLAELLLKSVAKWGLAASEDPVDVAQALRLAMRAAQALAFQLFETAREDYPVTIQALMATPEPALDVDLDARIDPAELLGFVELLDMLSDSGLSCIAPRLHRGWLDKKQSCREARHLSTGRAGFALTGGEREDLMLGLAITNRVFMVPPPFEVEAERWRRALPPMLDLVERLAKAAGSQAVGELIQRIMG